MKLIIAEKPSVSREIMKALNREDEHFTSCDNGEYYASENYYVTSQFGHLVELYMPEEYLPKGEYAPIPFFPKEYEFKVKDGCKVRYKTIQSLIKKKETTEIIHCGDADREGQLLIDLVLEKIGNTKPVTRPKIVALSVPAIRAALSRRENNDMYRNLRDEGFARMVCDFDYGINLSRYVRRKTKSKQPVHVGRVKGAILYEIYQRDKAIKEFVSTPYYKTISDIDGIKLIAKAKFNTFAEAQDLADKLQSNITVVDDIITAPVTKKRPKLFSQTTLQAFMSKRYGYSPDKTLSLTQGLYEKGYVTYPRTDSEYKLESEKRTVESILKIVDTQHVLEFREDKTVFDDKKVDSHSAIIITGKAIGTITDEERICYDAILNRFKAVFCKEPCVYNKTTITAKNGDEIFKISGETLVTLGWQAFEPVIKNEKKKGVSDEDNEDEEENRQLPKVEIGDILKTDFKAVEKKTNPPKHYTVTTLGEWMKNPFNEEKKNIESDNDEDDYKNILEGLQIGTTATRAPILKTLISKKYLSLNKSTYKITDRGIFLVEACMDLDINLSKEKTAGMGKLIKDVGKGKITLAEALSVEQQDIKDIVAKDKNCNKLALTVESIGDCPLCGKPVIEGKKGFGCSGFKDGCNFIIWKKSYGKTTTKAQAKKMIAKQNLEKKNSNK